MPSDEVDHGQYKYLRFLFGGLASMGATLAVQPLDLLKTQMQLCCKHPNRNYLSFFNAIIKNDGVLGLYRGTSAGLLKQAAYGSVRLGIYTNYSSNTEANLNLGNQLLIGMTAGACGVACSLPFDVILIRMMSDGCSPIEKRKNYKNVVHGLTRITSEEGFLKLWRGFIPSSTRAMVASGAQLSSYTQIKSFFKTRYYMEEGIKLYFLSSMIAGIITAFASNPLDMAKTKIQNMTSENDKLKGKGTLGVLLKCFRKEGIFSLWKGFLPYYIRTGCDTVLALIFFEELNRFYVKHYVKKSDDPSGPSGL